MPGGGRSPRQTANTQPTLSCLCSPPGSRSPPCRVGGRNQPHPEAGRHNQWGSGFLPPPRHLGKAWTPLSLVIRGQKQPTAMRDRSWPHDLCIIQRSTLSLAFWSLHCQMSKQHSSVLGSLPGLGSPFPARLLWSLRCITGLGLLQLCKRLRARAHLLPRDLMRERKGSGVCATSAVYPCRHRTGVHLYVLKPGHRLPDPGHDAVANLSARSTEAWAGSAHLRPSRSPPGQERRGLRAPRLLRAGERGGTNASAPSTRLTVLNDPKKRTAVFSKI